MNMTESRDIVYDKVQAPKSLIADMMPVVPSNVYKERLKRIISKMNKKGLNKLLLYADKEHCGNFEYVCGYDPRYEEAVLIIENTGKCAVILGNECIPLNRLSKIDMEPYLCQLFSLPNQPMENENDFGKILKKIGIKMGDQIGVCGWKLFPVLQSRRQYMEVPFYIIDEVQKIVGKENVINANDIFISPWNGVRTVNEVEQIAVFEFASSLASNQMLKCLEYLKAGISEQEACKELNGLGLPMTSHIMFCSGERADISLTSPTTRILEIGNPVVFSMSLRGGLTCRAGYLVENVDELQEENKDYIEKIVKPYYAMAVSWLESIGLGVTGGDLYELVEKTFPKEKFGWTLNPGHLTGMEEWMSSPIYSGSEIKLRSGMIIQQDIIPSCTAHYFTTNIEDGLLLADEYLRQSIQCEYPDMWERMQIRRAYIENELGIHLKQEVLPMSNSLGLLRPFMLNKNMGMKKVSNLQ